MEALRIKFFLPIAGGLGALLLGGCEAVLGLDWTPAERAEDAEQGAGGAGGAAEESAGAGGAQTDGGVGAGPSGPTCNVSACPSTGDACVVAACVGGACAAVAAPSGVSCTAGGGRVCDGGGACVECNVATDCEGPGAGCADHHCYSCKDGITNGSETGLDCGGPGCPKCGEGGGCLVDHDCAGKLACNDGVCEEKD